ncbi:tetratricopeptide repeat protein [Roseovarius faecimaris]|uniref:Tetratricopeptide repeat protein n=1 Tax=Roseovarius faecimaris TaxID=2494550 RepID=A0A6I6IWE0_9RHOB|nr:tetratricopeptide repeat protein [Roseovarius faecimaris]
MRMNAIPNRPLCPAFILDHHRAGRVAGAIDACALDIDISGFTRVTDALSVHGPQGAELLASIIRSVFDPLTSCIHEFGGFIANYSGDGFLALFPQSPGQEDAVRRGLAAAWQMRQTIRSRHTYKTALGTFEINAKLGLANGGVRWRIFADPEGKRHIFFFDGAPIIDATHVRQQAQTGHLGVSDGTRELIADFATTRRFKDPPYWRVEDVGNLPSPVAATSAPRETASLITDFFPDSVATSEGIAEFRQTANLFVKLEEPEGNIDRFVQSIFEAHERFGGFINSLMRSDKGCTAFVFWGAPKANVDDIERAMEFGAFVLEQPDFEASAGLTYGLAHAGFAGSPHQEVYTCSSRLVNLSARLMSTAEAGQMLTDKATSDHALNRFHFDFVGDLELKGFSERQPVFALGKRHYGQVRATSSAEIVERDTQIARLLDVVKDVFDHKRTGAAIVAGSSGSGKTALLEELEGRLKKPGADTGQTAFKIVELFSETGLGQPFGPFRNALTSLFGAPGVLDEGLRRASFEDAFGQFREQTVEYQALYEELGFVHSFLAAMVDVFIPESSYASVGPELRSSNMSRAVVAVISALARQNKLVIIADDLGDFDAQSSDVLRSLSTLQTAPLAVIASYRTDDTGSVPETCIDPEGLRDTVELPALTGDGIRRIAERSLGAPVSTRIVELLESKTAGNPLYVEQLIRTLSASGGFLHRGAGQTARVELAPDAAANIPHGLIGILLARIDRLPARLKSVIQVAAVLGEEFEPSLLTAMLGDEELVTEVLDEGQEQQIWTRQKGGRFRFNHAMLREAVYDMQLVNARRARHRQAADALERLDGVHDLARLSALAHHFERAELPDQAQHYLLQAGDMAYDSFDPASAAGYYRRLLNYNIEPELYVAVSARLGALLVLTSDWEEAVETLENGLSRVFTANDPLRESEFLIALGDALRNTGDFAGAREKLEVACAIARRAENREVLGKALGMLAGTYKYSGDYARALELYSQALEYVEAIEDDNLIAVTLAGIASIYGLLGKLQEAVDCNRRAIPILERLGNRQELVYPLGNLGIELFTIGAHQEALETLQQALQVSSEIGDRTGIWFASHFIGRVYHEMGDFEQALSAYGRAMLERRIIGGDSIPYDTLPHLASAKTSLGDHLSAISDLANHMEILKDGAPDHEHGLTYVEVARLIERRQELDPDAQTHLDALCAQYFGSDPMVWLKEADKHARAGASLGLNSRIRLLVKCAAIWMSSEGKSVRVLGCFAAAHALAEKATLRREAGFVLESAARLGVNQAELRSAEPLYLPFSEPQS